MLKTMLYVVFIPPLLETTKKQIRQKTNKTKTSKNNNTPLVNDKLYSLVCFMLHPQNQHENANCLPQQLYWHKHYITSLANDSFEA